MELRASPSPWDDLLNQLNNFEFDIVIRLNRLSSLTV